MSDNIIITSAQRTPTGHFNGCFQNTPAPELGGVAIQATQKSTALDLNLIDAVYMGCVLSAGLGQAPARQAALKAGLSNTTACVTINKMCGSGMQAIIFAHDTIKAGTHHCIIAGGMENMSRAPYLLEKARFGYRIGHHKIIDHMMLDGLEDAYQQNTAMGCFAENCAEKFNIDRKTMDQFALTSLERAINANQKKLFNDEIAPVTIQNKKGKQMIRLDEGPQTAKPEKIPLLRPAFKKDGSVTAANSSSISDGAAALTLMSEKQVKQTNVQPLAKIIGHHTHAQEPHWFTTAPIGAIKGLLEKIDWALDEVDLFEINEAFAVVTLVTMQELKIPHKKVNIHGGACVLGHPIGASGARILVTLIHALRQNNLKKGIAALCIGGGEATAIAVEII